MTAERCELCERMRMLISEVGLDPSRVHCKQEEGGEGLCILLCGTGNEGFTPEEVDDLTDRAIALSGWTS